ncbi:MAG: HlyD family efflux transporter periplasmic adaptor subunit [Lachnospiraceae bacterium]|nr:HlyD family efflux transporter periplasmic adaptor subunit [Lachnospiraceae bacterium]
MNQSDVRERRFSFNIGTILFGAIFIYIIITLVLYMTAGHVVSYRVTAGPLAQNQVYTALCVRSEQVVRAENSGYITYYAKENNKIRKTGTVFGIGNTKSETRLDEITDEEYRDMQNRLENFAGSFNPSNFLDAYNFGYEIESTLLSAQMPDHDGNTLGGTMTVNDQVLNVAPSDGVVVYAMDGYEDYDPLQVSAADFDSKQYVKTKLKTDETVSAGSPVYKLVDSETWSILVPLTSRQIVQLDGRTSIRVKFLKDSKTQTGKLTILTGEDGAYYGRVEFTSGMIRYINDRFLTVELVTNTQTGLKIPVSSVVNKRFYTIPEEYAALGGDSNNIGFLKQVVNDDNAASIIFTETSLYEHKDGVYYIDNEELTAGDILYKESDHTDTYTIGETAQLEGVYCLNQGYAVFRKILILDKNEDYCIVEKGTGYGIRQFDYIVLNASDVKEDEITSKR